MERIALCALADIPPDRPLRVQLADRKAVCVYRVGAGAAVSKDICPHKGAPLNRFGEVEGDSVTCLWHDCKFDLRTGAPSEGMCNALEIHSCEIDSDIVYLCPLS
jgi:nitrite reductase/ring-hydroxylating ferredoxin subunit